MGRIGYWAEVAFMSLTTAVMGGFAIAVIWGGVIDGTVTGTAKKTVFGAVCVAMTTFMALRLPRYFTQRRSEMRPAERVWSQEEIADFKVANILALVALRRLMRLKQGEDRWLTIAATCASLVEMITLIVIDGVWRPFFGYASPLALFQTVSTFVLGIIVVGGMIVVPLLAVLYYSGVLFERRHKGELDDITREFELIARMPYSENVLRYLQDTDPSLPLGALRRAVQRRGRSVSDKTAQLEPTTAGERRGP